MLEMVEGHRYLLDGVPIPGVSEVLQLAQDIRVLAAVPEARPYITVWPSYRSPAAWAAINKGTAVHKWIDNTLHGIPQDALPQGIGREECEHYMAWRNKELGHVLHMEELVHHSAYYYAGTMDNVSVLGLTRWLIDYKTGKKIYGSSHLQIAAYYLAAYDQGIRADKAGILLLQKHGYTFQEVNLKKLIPIWEDVRAAVIRIHKV